MVESFPNTSCTCNYPLYTRCACSPRLSHRTHVYLFIFLFFCTKIWSLLLRPGDDEDVSNEQIISTHKHEKCITYTSFTNVASGCAKRLPSDRPTELNKTQTNGFYLRDESNLTNALLFSIVHFVQLAWPIKGKNQDHDLLRATFPDAWHRLTTLLRVLIGSRECTVICSDWPD